MLLPAFIHIILFNYAPMSGLYIAFSEYKVGGSLFGGKFVGLDFFRKVLSRTQILPKLITNTLAINLSSLLLGTFIPLILAILLSEIRWKRGAKVVQTVTFFPYFISWTIAYALCTALLSVNSGVFNQVLVKYGILQQGINILGESRYAWGMMIFIGLWKGFGYTMVIYLSSISGISQELYEAAALDGVNAFQRIRHITIPSLLPTVSVLLIMNAGWVLGSNLEQYFIFMNVTNMAKLETLDMYIYRYGLGLMDFSFATAMNLVKTVVSVSILLFVNWLSKHFTDRAIV